VGENGGEVVERRVAFPRCLTRPLRPVRTPDGFVSDACRTHGQEAHPRGREAHLAQSAVVSHNLSVTMGASHGNASFSV
jgi:hypothetical protein